MISSIRKDLEDLLPGSSSALRMDNLSLYFNRLCRGIDEPSQREVQAKHATLDALLLGYSNESHDLYRHAFEEWKQFVSTLPDTLCFEMETAGPMVVGKGDQNVHEFGMTLQLPWGMPVIPGSAIKGVMSTFVSDRGDELWHKAFTGSFKGKYALIMFGGTDEEGRSFAGCLDLLDAWWVPRGKSPFKEDIINVHYQHYYRGQDYRDQECWPHGMENPVPNKFLVLKPGERFLFVIRGVDSLRGLAKNILIQAAGEYGFGSKTRVGYGRMKYVKTEKELRKEISGLSDEELIQLFKEGRVLDVLEQEVRRRSYNETLRPLFMKFRPARVLLAELEQRNPKNLQEAGTIRKQFRHQLPNAKINRSDPDIQRIFEYCYPLLGGQGLDNTWLNALAPTAEDYLQGKDSQKIQDLITEYDASWPPLYSFKETLENLEGLTDRERRECLALLELKLEEDENH